MSEEEYETRFQALLDKAATLPSDQREKLEPLVEQSRILHASIVENKRRIEDVLSSWQLELKYFLFALEATARERAQHSNRPHPENDPE